MSLLRTTFYAVVLLCCGDLRNVFDGYALAGVGFDVVPVLWSFGEFNIPDKAISVKRTIRKKAKKPGFYPPLNETRRNCTLCVKKIKKEQSKQPERLF